MGDTAAPSGTAGGGKPGDNRQNAGYKAEVPRVPPLPIPSRSTGG